MRGDETIAVGLTHTNAGAWALAWAIVEAIARDGRLEIHRAVDADDLWGARLDELSPEVVGARDRLGADRVSLVATPLDLASSLIRAGETVDLIVVSGGEKTGPAGRRATFRRVAAHAHCPVVAVRPVDRADGPFSGHVVVGVDGSAASTAALKFGFRYAERHRLPLAAVAIRAELSGEVWVDDRMLETHLVHPSEALTELDERIEQLRHDFPGVPTRRAVFGGPAAPGLLHAATGARLLVVGARGIPRTEISDPPPGSVSQAVVAYANCPVAVVHAAAPVDGAGSSRSSVRVARPASIVR